MPLTNIYKQKFQECLETNKEVGFVERVVPPIVYVKGLPGAKIWEVVYFETGFLGIVTALVDDYVEILNFTNESVATETQVSRSGDILKVPVGDSLLGQIVDPLGSPIQEGLVIPNLLEKRSIDNPPLGIDHRERVTEPLETGVSMVDFLIPLGRGQRELVIGDRNIGKTTFVLQSILTQVRKGSICIYAAIGKKKHSIKAVENFFDKYNTRENSVIVASSASDPIGFIYITPYTAMTIAEYFRDQGKDVLLILDDLTDHAKYYRELSLLARKFPGRDAYPGDVFYTHARLLERGGNFKIGNNKSAAITCLIVAETVEGDMSGYIQTNLMSITDGHIFFDQDLYKRGKRPAINHFLSVTRVGRQTQSAVRWGINRELSSFLILHNKTERFIHFGAEVNEGIRSTLLMGERVNFFFDQGMEEILDLNVQILAFGLIWTGVLRDVSEGKIKYYMSESQKLYKNDPKFREKTDKMVDTCTDFNQFLGKISAQHKEVIDYLEGIR
jgi:F-type H+-transporting ATPase subunit alpha